MSARQVGAKTLSPLASNKLQAGHSSSQTDGASQKMEAIEVYDEIDVATLRLQMADYPNEHDVFFGLPSNSKWRPSINLTRDAAGNYEVKSCELTSIVLSLYLMPGVTAKVFEMRKGRTNPLLSYSLLPSATPKWQNFPILNTNGLWGYIITFHQCYGIYRIANPIETRLHDESTRAARENLGFTDFVDEYDFLTSEAIFAERKILLSFV